MYVCMYVCMHACMHSCIVQYFTAEWNPVNGNQIDICLLSSRKNGNSLTWVLVALTVCFTYPVPLSKMGTHLLASLGSKGKNRNSLACLRNAGSHSAVKYCLYQLYAGLTPDSKGDPTSDTEEPESVRRRQETPYLSVRLPASPDVLLNGAFITTPPRRTCGVRVSTFFRC